MINIKYDLYFHVSFINPLLFSFIIHVDVILFKFFFVCTDFFGVNADQMQEKVSSHHQYQSSSSIKTNSTYYTQKKRRLTHEKRLIRDLLNSYPTIYARPIRNISQPLVIHFGLTLTQLFDLGSTGQKMQTNTWKTFMWQDMNLIWDPEDYGGLATVCLPADSIWTPVR